MRINLLLGEIFQLRQISLCCVCCPGVCDYAFVLHESCHWYMWLPAYVTTIWYSSHHRCAECTRARIAKYTSLCCSLSMVDPWVPAGWFSRWYAARLFAVRRHFLAIFRFLAKQGHTHPAWTWSGHTLIDKILLKGYFGKKSTQGLSWLYWNCVIGRVWRADTKQSWVFISVRCFLNWKLRWSSVWAIN